MLLTNQRLTTEWERKLRKITLVAWVGAWCWVVKGTSELYQVPECWCRARQRPRWLSRFCVCAYCFSCSSLFGRLTRSRTHSFTHSLIHSHTLSLSRSSVPTWIMREYLAARSCHVFNVL